MPAEEKLPSELTLLQNMEIIINCSRKRGLDATFQEKARPNLEYISNILGVTPLQAALFAHFLNRANDTYINMETVADSLKVSSIQLIQYMDEFDELEKKKLICARRDGKSILYRVPLDVINSLRKGARYEPNPHTNLSFGEFFSVLDSLFEQRADDELTFSMLCDEIKTLLENNAELEFVRRIKSLPLSDFEDKALLIFFCHLFVNNDDDLVGFHDLDDIFRENTIHRRIIYALRDGGHILLENGLLENANSSGFGDRDFFRLSARAKEDLLSEINIHERQARDKKGIITPESITARELFFNKKETEKLGELKSLLEKNNFEQVLKRLEESGLRRGFACIFYGPPGSGKTESAYQIARETGRGVMAVEIAETKSMWFGESERRIKEIFDRYRAHVEAAAKAKDLTPVLLFNEADAVIGKRIEITTSSVAQTENAMQNIILEEIEKLNGILIATTNLTKNMDPAFERRFLYKIEFTKPAPAVRRKIWQSIVSGISEENAAALSELFEFSGGQIENIARRHVVEKIITGEPPSFETMRAWCDDELFARKRGGGVGFRQMRHPSGEDGR